jgi:ubiquitin carboxyl-terminal hydrolase 5/13
MNSVVQLLLSGTVPELSHRYCSDSKDVKQHPLFEGQSPKDVTTDLLSQTAKLSLALTSGTFAVPEEALKDPDQSLDPQYRIQPRMFKHVVAGNHVDFRTGQQQDAAQFLQYMLEQLDRAEQGGAQRFGSKGEKFYPTSHLFSFRTTTRLVCSTDQKIKYKDSATETMLSLPVPMEKATIVIENEPDQKRHKTSTGESKEDDKLPVPTLPFAACLDAWSAETTMEDYRWPHLGNSVAVATSETKLTNFPRYLLVQTQRYTLGADWTPKKLEVNLDIPQELDLTPFKSKGPQEGDNLVPEEEEEETAAAPAAAAAQVDENALAQLMDMGFGFNGCKRALLAVGGSDVQSAMNWVFEHNQDPDFNDPVPEAGAAPKAASADGVDDGVVMSLVENLGCFTFDQVRAALKHTSGAADRAADWLFSHMEDLDGAIAALASSGVAAAPASSGPAIPLDDGEGKYTMVGMVSHIGKHTGSGHYVAHLKRDDKWIIFNDEKVAISASPPLAHAYLYLYQRTDTIGSPDPNY